MKNEAINWFFVVLLEINFSIIAAVNCNEEENKAFVKNKRKKKERQRNKNNQRWSIYLLIAVYQTHTHKYIANAHILKRYINMGVNTHTFTKSIDWSKINK